LICEEVQGRYLLTNFHGIDFTRDKLFSLIRKWHTLIEGHTEASTKDGYRLRLFCIAFTARRQKQVKKSTYAKSSQIKDIRAIMVEKMNNLITTNDFKDVVKHLIDESSN